VAEAASTARVQAAEQTARLAASEALAAVESMSGAGAQWEQAIGSLTNRVRELEGELAKAVSAEEAAGLEAALAAARSETKVAAAAAAEVLLAKMVAEDAATTAQANYDALVAASSSAALEASLAEVAAAAREEQVWTLSSQVRELQEQLSYAATEQEVAALEAALSAAQSDAAETAAMMEAAAASRIQVCPALRWASSFQSPLRFPWPHTAVKQDWCKDTHTSLVTSRPPSCCHLCSGVGAESTGSATKRSICSHRRRRRWRWRLNKRRS
jgi:predicted  nucleic acid-binding Zn-ribbon protein